MKMDIEHLMKWTNWAVLTVLAFCLLFTKTIVDWLEMENTLESVLVLIVPLIILAAVIEWMSRRMKSAREAK